MGLVTKQALLVKYSWFLLLSTVSYPHFDDQREPRRRLDHGDGELTLGLLSIFIIDVLVEDVEDLGVPVERGGGGPGKWKKFLDVDKLFQLTIFIAVNNPRGKIRQARNRNFVYLL